MDDKKTLVGGAGYNDKLLVIGRDIGFSTMLTDYAIEIAVRMEYSIIALNLDTYSTSKKFFSGSKVKLVDEKELDIDRKRAVEIFRKEAEENGIAFENMAMTGDLDSVVRDIYKETGKIDLVMMEPEYVNESEDMVKSVPVFSLASG